MKSHYIYGETSLICELNHKGRGKDYSSEKIDRISERKSVKETKEVEESDNERSSERTVELDLGRIEVEETTGEGVEEEDVGYGEGQDFT
jgi:hypothetical protein